MRNVVKRYNDDLHKYFNETKVTDLRGEAVDLADALIRAAEDVMAVNSLGKKVMFVGNGGSAAVASHKALDYWFTGRIRGVAFTDHANLTCISNDFGYQNVYTKQIEMFADEGDILVAISSSGNSENIVSAVEAARHRGCRVFTFSGFKESNRLRGLGDLNFYTPVSHYNKVESIHLLLCDCILEIITEKRKQYLINDERSAIDENNVIKEKNEQEIAVAKNTILVAFDRDDTLIYDDGYFGKKETWKNDIKIYDGAIEAVKMLNKFADVVVASNQIGVARGYYGAERVQEINQHIDSMIKAEGALINNWYFSPYVERAWAQKEGLNLNAPWVVEGTPQTRKPGIGMLQSAAKDFGRDLASYKKIFVIGDSLDDLNMALNANGIGVWFYNGKNGDLWEKVKNMEIQNPKRIFYASSLIKAAEIIKAEAFNNHG